MHCDSQSSALFEELVSIFHRTTCKRLHPITGSITCKCLHRLILHSDSAVISALNVVRVCAQWLSVADVWRMQYSTGSHISQLRVSKPEPQPADENADADSSVDSTNSDAVKGLLRSGFRVGSQYGVVDSILLHLCVSACDTLVCRCLLWVTRDR